MSFVEVIGGDSPLILGMPHTGTELPDECAARLNATGLALADTDWHVHELYDGLVERATRVRTRIHRYAIDVNRDPEGASLYPGRNTTGLCPLSDFDGRPIYREGQEPDAAEIARRRRQYHAPYHAALEAEMRRVTRRHGFALLYDCHSIRSMIPFLFDGTLPDLSIGTDGGRSCAPEIERTVSGICDGAGGYSTVLNGRFRGGWTTRHYGRPDTGWHAIQMELAQSTYLGAEAPPWTLDPAKSERLRVCLRAVLNALRDWRPA